MHIAAFMSVLPEPSALLDGSWRVVETWTVVAVMIGRSGTIGCTSFHAGKVDTLMLRTF